MNGRIEFLEKAEHVQPETFREVCESISEHENKFQSIDTNFVSLEMKIGALGDRISEIKGFNRTEQDERKFNQLRELIANVEDEVKNIRENLTKTIQDTNTDRANQTNAKAILDTNVENVTTLGQQLMKSNEEQAALNSRLKKVIGLVQNINTDLSDQLKALSMKCKVNTNTIDQLKEQLAQGIVQQVSQENIDIPSNKTESILLRKISILCLGFLLKYSIQKFSDF